MKKSAKTSVAVPAGQAAKGKPAATRPPAGPKKAVAGAKKAGAAPKAQPKTKAKTKAKAKASKAKTQTKTKAKTKAGKSAGRTASSRKSNRPRRLTKRH
jgi:hypothetical protein